MPVISAHGRRRQEDEEFQVLLHGDSVAGLSYMSSSIRRMGQNTKNQNKIVKKKGHSRESSLLPVNLLTLLNILPTHQLKDTFEKSIN